MYCKNCIKKISDIFTAESLKNSNDYNLASKKTAYKICMLMNIPFIENLFLEMQETNKIETLIVDYVKKVTSDKQLSVMTFFDGKIILSEDVASENEYHIMPEQFAFWGNYHKPEDIVFLENEFSGWTTYVTCDSHQEKMLLREICILTLLIRQKQKIGEKFKEEVEMRDKIIKSAGYEPNQQKKNEDSRFKESFGNFVERIEQTTPAETHDDLFDDVDNIRGLIGKYLLKPLKNILMGSKDFTDMEVDE